MAPGHHHDNDHKRRRGPDSRVEGETPYKKGGNQPTFEVNDFDPAVESSDWYPECIKKWYMFVKSNRDLGLCGHASGNLKPVGGELKKFCSDFIVKEVDANGLAVDEKPPRKIESEEDEEIEDVEEEEDDDVMEEGPEKLLGPQDMNKGRTLLIEQIGEDSVDNFISFLFDDEQKKFDIASPARDASISSIVLITLQHYKVFVEGSRKEVKSEGGDEPATERQIIEIRKVESADLSSCYKLLNANTINWERLGGRYCEFVLAKKDIDTMAATNMLHKKLNTNLTYRGTKDKRAVTFQRVRAKEVTAKQVALACKEFLNIKVHDFKYAKEPFKLSDSNGNQFIITLRDVKVDDKDIKDSMEALRDVGFINYFGVQRFGTAKLPTFSVGVEWLNGKFEEAVDIIIGGSTGSRFTHARKAWFTDRNARKVREMFPYKSNIERTILQYFIKNKNTRDCYSALESLPHLTQSLYLHSYQSYVWNHMVTKRIEVYGSKPAVGDIYEHVDDKTGSKTYDFVTSDNIGSVSIHDIVLPMPGFDVKYPTNLLDQYTEFMSKDGLDPLKMKRKQKKASLPGAYRKMFGKPMRLDWEIKTYDDENSIVTADGVFDKKCTGVTKDGKHKAVVVALTLDSSVYATTALREIMKD